MKKNSQIHLFLESDLKEKLENEAESKGVSVSELCRQKLRERDRFEKMEDKLDYIINKLVPIIVQYL